MVQRMLVILQFVIQAISPSLSWAQIKSSPANTPVTAKPAATTPTNPRVETPKNPNLLFEGYSKILIAGKHAGFAVLRYEFDPKKKRFTASYMIKTDESGGNLLEALKAVADQDLKPISYEYTASIDKKTKVIDAKFANNRMTATLKEGKDTKKLVNDIPKGSFLGIFLYYVILRSPSGLKTETRYDYKAVAEEDGQLYDGVAIVGKEEKFNGIRAFKATNKFKEVSNTFYITDTGDVLMTETPGADVKTILVAKPEEAIGQLKVPNSNMVSLFGEIPAGTTNTVSRNLKAETIRQNFPTPTKKEGLPPDPKIMIKGQQENESEGQ